MAKHGSSKQQAGRHAGAVEVQVAEWGACASRCRPAESLALCPSPRPPVTPNLPWARSCTASSPLVVAPTRAAFREAVELGAAETTACTTAVSVRAYMLGMAAGEAVAAAGSVDVCARRRRELAAPEEVTSTAAMPFEGTPAAPSIPVTAARS